MSAVAVARAAVLAVAVVVAVVVSSVTTVVPAAAEPPVGGADHERIHPGEIRVFDVLANDTDPDGDAIEICRIADVPAGSGYYVDNVNDLAILVLADAEATDDLVITYYLCDFETLVPVTLTIDLQPLEDIRVTRAARPGRLRVTNPNDQTVRFLFGDFDERRPDGRLRVRGHATETIRVRRRTIDWVAYLPSGYLVDYGKVRRIRLPRDRTAPASILPSEAERSIWAGRRGTR